MAYLAKKRTQIELFQTCISDSVSIYMGRSRAGRSILQVNRIVALSTDHE